MEWSWRSHESDHYPLLGHRDNRAHGEGIGSFRAVIEAWEPIAGSMICCVTTARFSWLTHAFEGHDTTPHQDRQARRSIIGQSLAHQPNPFGLYPAGTLSAIARLDAMPRQAGKAVGEGQDSVAGLAGAAKSGIAVSDAFRPTRIGLVPRPRLRADRKHGP